MMRRIAMVLTLLLSFTAVPAHAVQPDEVMNDPAQEARARVLSREIRCMVCQNQSIDDSDAPLARDLRLLVRERIASGDSDRQVLDFLVARYGQFVLLKPRFESETALLWLFPPLVLIIGATLVFIALRRRAVRERGSEVALSADETRRVEALMATLPSGHDDASAPRGG